MPKPLTQTTGRRKAAIARVRLRPGNGTIVVNRPGRRGLLSFGHPPHGTDRALAAGREGGQSTTSTPALDGGGVSGQAGALRSGIARALAELEPDLRAPLKRAGFLTRDPREKEQKKYGLKKARKAPAVLQALAAGIHGASARAKCLAQDKCCALALTA